MEVMPSKAPMDLRTIGVGIQKLKTGNTKGFMSKCLLEGLIALCLCISDNDKYTGDRILY